MVPSRCDSVDHHNTGSAKCPLEKQTSSHCTIEKALADMQNCRCSNPKRLLAEKDLTLQKAIEIVQGMEAAT